jgi:hypothetical protein
MSKRTSKLGSNGSISIRRTASVAAVAAVAAVAVSACGSSSSGSSSSSSASSASGASSSTSSSSSSSAAGNGIASKSADQILSSAITAAEGAKSLHVVGAIKNGGQSVGLNLTIVAGKGASGTISEGSASFKLVDTRGSFYMQPDPAFLIKFAHSKAAADLFKGRWLKGSSTDPSFASFGELTSIKTLMGSLTQAHGTLTKGATSTLQGQSVIALKSSKGGTMYVATTGQPYPLQVSKNSGGQSGTVRFTDYNKPFTITAPANSINIEQLEKSG